MALSLFQAAHDAEDVAAGLQIFEDNVPDDPELHLSIRDLLHLAERLRALNALYHPQINTLLNEDVDLLLFSLQYTLGRVRAMFGETRYVRDGQRLYRVAWDDMCYELRQNEQGQGLRGRLSLYELFINDMVNSLIGRHVPHDQMSRHREWIDWLLRNQELAEEPPEIVHDRIVGRPSIRHPRVDPPFQSDPPIPIWDNIPQTQEPNGQGYYETSSPTSSTSTQSSSQTFTTLSSEIPSTGHWASAIFDRRPPENPFDNIRGVTRCYGKPERGLVDKLHQHKFLEVAKFRFRTDNVTARFYWRPEDYRTRLLISTTDQLGMEVRFCVHLTELKAVRQGNLLFLFRRDYRVDRTRGPLTVWAEFRFDIYEKLVLFYCIFSGMKNQDWKPYSPILRDWYYKPQNVDEPQDEVQLFSAPIEDEGCAHFLRVYFDYDSRGSRLEARARGGPMKFTPSWTAFITEQVQDARWITKIGSRKVQLDGLRKYIFVDGYPPPRSRNEETVLTFRDSTDANAFMAIVGDLHHFQQ